MMRRIAGISFLGVLAVAAVYGLAFALEHYPRAADTAASVILHRQNEPGNTAEHAGEFVSLDHVISDALTRLQNAAASRPESGIDRENEAAEPRLSADPDTVPGNAIVHIYCTQTTREYKRSAYGTGFFVSDTGAIMTNAHVAQFLLLQDAPELGRVDCSASAGGPGDPEFSLAVLYLSPSWLLKHARFIDSDEPRGTGESDFAILYVTGTTDGSPLPARWSYLPPSTNALNRGLEGRTVIVAGYPVRDDGSASQIAATTTVTALYTFGGGFADIFTVAASPLGHQGASGGPVIDHLGRAIGIITTKDEGTTILNAITIAHIDRSIKSETGFDLVSYLRGDLGHKARIFNETISPILRELLAEHLR